MGTQVKPAFNGCTAVRELRFGREVSNVPAGAFLGLPTVQEIKSKAEIPPVCGAQALDDINKWDCQVFVPTGSMELYQEADQWKEFFFYTEYDFPEFGDVNGDWDTNVSDIGSLINIIVGATRINEEADLDGDGVVNANDMALLVNFLVGLE